MNAIFPTHATGGNMLSFRGKDYPLSTIRHIGTKATRRTAADRRIIGTPEPPLPRNPIVSVPYQPRKTARWKRALVVLSVLLLSVAVVVGGILAVAAFFGGAS